MLCRRSEHLPQQVAVARLQLVALAQRPLRLGDPLGEGVAHALELGEVGDAWSSLSGLHPGIDRKTREGLAVQAGELVLQPPDLTAQLSARKPLIASNPKRSERLVFKQIRHKTQVECKSLHLGRKRAPR